MATQKAQRRKRRPRDIADEEPQYEETEIPGTGIQMKARNPRHEHAPNQQPYVFDKELMKDLSVGVDMGLNIMLTGPTGCGKTLAVKALASHLGYPMVRFNCDGETRVSNLRGMMKPAAKEGVLTLKFSQGALVEAMRYGYWVLLDEIDAAIPSVLFVLQPVLEEDNRTVYVPETGKRISAHPDFRIFATGNTVGYRSQARARYAGTTALNDAFLDRFAMVLAVDYPEAEQEAERIRANVPDAPQIYIDGVCRVAHKLRTDQRFKSDFSTRRCVQWVRLACQFDRSEGIYRAAEMAVLRKLTNPVDAKVAREVMGHIFDYGPWQGEQ